MADGAHPCPLCGSPTAATAGPAPRRFHDCPACGLMSVARADLPSPADELAQYRLHRNDAADPRYRAFLGQLTGPLTAKLAAGAEGLDFGCGPGPAVRPMLAEQGFTVTDHDPFFAPDAAALERRYDFVACTEVVEHFHDPAAGFATLDGLLKPGGWLGVMTSLLTDDVALPGWSYARDPTHVAFYRPLTLAWIAGRHGWTLETDAVRIALFRKGGFD